MSEEKEKMTIRRVENAVYAGDWDDAWLGLRQILERMDRVTAGYALKSSTGEIADAMSLYSRLASMITAVMCDTRVDFGKFFGVFLAHKRTISVIFRLTTFRNMDSVVGLNTQRAESDPQQGHSAMLKGIIGAMFESPMLNPEGILKGLPDDFATVFWLSLIDRDYFLTFEDLEKRRKIVELSHYIEEGTLPSWAILNRTSNIWMNCSYIEDANKHEVKSIINRLIRNSLEKQGIKELPLPAVREKVDRPRLVMLSERFTSNHAMYKCYSPSISKLVEHFEVIIVTDANGIDEAAEAMFSRVEKLPPGYMYHEVKDLIDSLKADIIYYPSIGMSGWTTMCCQMRLAPIQMMTLGHPASSMSDKIDYVLTQESMIGDPSCFSETLIALEDEAFIYARTKLDLTQIERVDTTETIKIAVPSNGNKITASFIECCKAVYEKVSRPIEFHFFPNLPEAQSIEFRLHFEKLFPNVIHKHTSYVNYLSLIAQCHIQLSPFPFGNTNGYIDGLQVGLPIVSMDGAELHSCIDNAFGRRAGMPEFCLTSNEEDYVEAIVRLVENDDERQNIVDSLKDLDISKVTLEGATNESPYLVDTVKWLYNNHEEIQAAGRKCWLIEDRANFPAAP